MHCKLVIFWRIFFSPQEGLRYIVVNCLQLCIASLQIVTFTT